MVTFQFYVSNFSTLYKTYIKNDMKTNVKEIIEKYKVNSISKKVPYGRADSARSIFMLGMANIIQLKKA